MTTNRIVALVVTGVLSALQACAPSGEGDDARVSGSTVATRQAEAILERPRSANEENGIELARWSVAADDDRIRRALGRHATRTIPLAASVDALGRNGFRVAVVRDEELPSLLAELGGTTSAITVWHGQMTTWREIAAASYDPTRGSTRMVLIDGRGERLTGWLRLMARGWTVPVEDGAVFELTVVPQLVRDKTDLSGLLNRDRLRERVFSDLSISAELPRDTSLVIVAESPEPPADDDPEGPADAAGSARSQTSGPPADLPPTLGEALLEDSEAQPPRRVVLVLRVRIPATFFPGETPPSMTR